MAAYLTDHPPVRDQWYFRRNRPLTGCTVLHSAENAFDDIGADTGAEGIANYCRIRTTPGTYHDIVDSDSEIYLVDYIHGAYHDGTGSNNWALSLSFACRTTDWARMTPAKRKAMLRNGARAFLRQQAWRKANGAPATELRLITKAQSDAGMSGFTYHGYRDPGRRTDPGSTPAAPFPFTEFVAEIRALQGGGVIPPDIPKGPPEMILIRNSKGTVALLTDFAVWVPDPVSHAGLRSAMPTAQIADKFFDQLVGLAGKDETDLAATRKAAESIAKSSGHLDAMIGDHVKRYQAFLAHEGITDPTAPTT